MKGWGVQTFRLFKFWCNYLLESEITNTGEKFQELISRWKSDFCVSRMMSLPVARDSAEATAISWDVRAKRIKISTCETPRKHHAASQNITTYHNAWSKCGQPTVSSWPISMAWSAKGRQRIDLHHLVRMKQLPLLRPTLLKLSFGPQFCALNWLWPTEWHQQAFVIFDLHV